MVVVVVCSLRLLSLAVLLCVDACWCWLMWLVLADGLFVDCLFVVIGCCLQVVVCSCMLSLLLFVGCGGGLLFSVVDVRCRCLLLVAACC